MGGGASKWTGTEKMNRVPEFFCCKHVYTDFRSKTYPFFSPMTDTTHSPHQIPLELAVITQSSDSSSSSNLHPASDPSFSLSRVAPIGSVDVALTASVAHSPPHEDSVAQRLPSLDSQPLPPSHLLALPQQHQPEYAPTEPEPEPEPEHKIEHDSALPTPESKPEQQSGLPQIPQTSLTFLLVSGRRRTMSFEPETTIARVKELVWNAWPSGELPPSHCYPAWRNLPVGTQNGKTSAHQRRRTSGFCTLAKSCKTTTP
jgi:hypothetical protein